MIIIHIKLNRLLGEFQMTSALGRMSWGESKRCTWFT